MGRHSEEQIEKMIKEAEQFADEDKKVKERVDAKMSFVSYLHGMRNAGNVEGALELQEKRNKKKMKKDAKMMMEPKMDSLALAEC